MTRKRSSIVSIAIFLALGLGATGCSETSAPPPKQTEQKNMEEMKKKMGEMRKDKGGVTGPSGEPEKDKDKDKEKSK